MALNGRSFVAIAWSFVTDAGLLVIEGHVDEEENMLVTVFCD